MEPDRVFASGQMLFEAELAKTFCLFVTSLYHVIVMEDI
jgi:hypothetical protein